MDWIRRVGEYRTLVGKRDQLGYPLGAVEQARLEELEAFFARAAADYGRLPFVAREAARAPIALTVSFSAGRVPGFGEASNLSTEGMFVKTSEQLPVGTRTEVRVIDRHSGDEWRFGAEVVRIELGSADQRGMALRFRGIPLALRLGHRSPERPRFKRAA
jgi:hypothetical protein